MLYLVRKRNYEEWLIAEIGPFLPVAATNADSELRSIATELESGRERVDDPALELELGLGGNAHHSDVKGAILQKLLAKEVPVASAAERVDGLAESVRGAIAALRVTPDNRQARLLAQRLQMGFMRLMKEAFENDLTVPDDLSGYQFDADQPDATDRFLGRFRA